MTAGETQFNEICPYCNTERGTTCDYLEPIKPKCTCADYRHCDYYLYIQSENGDALEAERAFKAEQAEDFDDWLEKHPDAVVQGHSYDGQAESKQLSNGGNAEKINNNKGGARPRGE